MSSLPASGSLGGSDTTVTTLRFPAVLPTPATPARPAAAGSASSPPTGAAAAIEIAPSPTPAAVWAGVDRLPASVRYAPSPLPRDIVRTFDHTA